MERSGAKGDFRSNLHRGGSSVKVQLTQLETVHGAEGGARHGAQCGGRRLLRSKRGPVVMEVNSSPGLEGIEKTTGVDVAKSIIEFLEKNAKPGKTRTRGKG